MSRKVVPIAVVVAVLLVSAGLHWAFGPRGPEEPGHSHDATEQPPIPNFEEFGPANAPIKIRASYVRPSADFDYTIALLRKLVDEYDPHLHVTAANAATVSTRPTLSGAESTQGSLTVNGRSTFTRVVDDEMRTIEFAEAVYPYGSRWREADLRAFINAELRRLNLYAQEHEAELESLETGQTCSAGNPASKVRVMAYYPMPEECVEITLQVLREVAEEYGDRVYFEFIDTSSDEGFKVWCDAETVCHGIVINGKQEHEVTVNGETKKVTFFAPVDTEWTRAELEAALDAELATVSE